MKVKQIKSIVSYSGMLLLSLLFGQSVLAGSKKMTAEEKIEAKVQQAEKEQLINANSPKTRKDFYLNREFAINEILLQQARDARDKEDFEQAKSLYERVLSFSPNNQFALNGLVEIVREKAQSDKLKQAQNLIGQNKLSAAERLVHDVLLENPQHKNAQHLSDQIKARMGDSNSMIPKLKGKFDKPVTLELRNADIKLVFDTLSRDTGINFILDKDIRPDTKANIFAKNMPIEEAIEMVIASNGLDKKVISESTVIIYPSNPQKDREYQDLLIRNFYLNSTKAKDVAALLKTMIKTKDIYVYERLNMIVMRDTPEVINLAEKLVASVDLEDPEVMLEIEVLEVSRTKAQTLGIVFPNQLSVLNTDTALTLQSLKEVNSAQVGVSPNPAINFRKTVGDINLLSNPRIRVKNNEKAKILVGDKIPVITTTSTANVGISESVSYVDVGLKLEVEPRITLDNFVNINIGLEVSTLGERTVTANGAAVFAIGTRNTQTTLRLKDGETQILAGLILDNERDNVSKLPGLGDIPLLGRLFSNDDSNKSKTEIVLAITPRVLGNVAIPNAQNSEYWSGTANQYSDKFKKTAPNNSGPSTPSQPTSAFEQLLEQRRQRESQLEVQPEQIVPAIDPSLVPPFPVQQLPNNAQSDGGTSLVPNSNNNNGGQTTTAPVQDSFIPSINFIP